MKAVAITFVLIIAAAIILWYGNTLNSWVLGGLIGGLAALLISIPISLLLFSHLSKRHDERLRAEEQEELELEHEYELPAVPERLARRPREVESYVINEERAENNWREEPEQYYREPRALPSPQHVSPPRPVQFNRNSERVPSVPQQTSPSSVKRTQYLQPTGKETTYLRPTTRKLSANGQEYTTPLSQHRSDALRTARQEAAKQRQDDEIEVIPSNFSRRDVISRPNHALAKQERVVQRPSRPSRQLPSQASSSRSTRDIVDAQPVDERMQRTDRNAKREARTDTIPSQNQQNDAQINAQSYPRVRRTSRRDQTESYENTRDQPFFEDDDSAANSFRTIQRRAPYMDEDDPMLQEFKQQLDVPQVRRSSRPRNEEIPE